MKPIKLEEIQPFHTIEYKDIKFELHVEITSKDIQEVIPKISVEDTRDLLIKIIQILCKRIKELTK